MRDSVHSVVLAAGLGTRMHPVTRFKPKPLVLFKGVPLICHVINGVCRYSDRITVVTGYMCEQFMDVPYSYPSVSIVAPDAPNMMSAFLTIVGETESRAILGVSSDLVFDADIVAQAYSFWKRNMDVVHVFLTHDIKQTYKKWDWVVHNDVLLDLRVSDVPTGYEKVFVFFPKAVLERYTCSFTMNLGVASGEFTGHEQYNRGWIYLIHRLLLDEYQVQCHILNGQIYNVNSLSDLVPVTSADTAV
jgi:NDP-sugar pyrophosphorylase family protein